MDQATGPNKALDDTALRESEERLRLATQSAGVGILDYDVAADRGTWSPEVCAVLGLPAGNLATLADSLTFVHDVDHARVERAMAAALDPRGSGALTEEFRIHRADTGETRWVSAVCRTRFEGEGDSRHAVRFTGVMTDITARRGSEERHAFLLALADALRPISDPLDVQETAARLVGEYLQVNRVGYAELSEREYVIRREYVRGVEPLTAKSLAGGFGVALNEAYRRGETVVVHDVHTDPRFTDAERITMKGRQIAAFIGVMLIKGGRLVAAFGANQARPRRWTTDEIELIRDVAERTWEAAERARVEVALREREGRLRLALNASAGGYWIWEAASNHVEWDEGFRERYRFDPDQPPTFEAWLSRVHPDDRKQVLDLLDEMRHTTKETWDNTFRIVLPDGTVSWIQSLGRADRETDGRVKRLTGLELDVTQRRQASDAALHERAIELERRTAQLSRMASDLTLAEQHAREQLAKTLHDGLQQLLVSASLNVDRQLKRDRQIGASEDLLVQAKGHLDEAIAAARSLSFELFPPVLHTSGLPAALTWLAERTRHEYGLVVDVTVDPRANSERKDVRTLLFESVRELLFNAVKHAKVDRLAMDLVLQEDDNTLCITVADEGVGFDPARLADRSSGSAEGWGLFSIRERLTLLGGRFEIDSAPGHGTRFRVIAPRGSLAEERASNLAVEPWTPASSQARPLRILLVDDHPTVLKVFRELLEERPELQVVGNAANGLEAIRQAHALQPDVILMDVSMPQMDGIEATRRICAEIPSIRVLGLSTHPRTESQHPIEVAGAAGFYTKGVDTQRLIEDLLSIHATMAASPDQPAL